MALMNKVIERFGELFKDPRMILVVVGIIAIVILINIPAIQRLAFNYNMKDIDRMSGVQFEYMLVEYFKSQGYKAIPTKRSHDFGADLVLERAGEKTVIQAKRYSKRLGLKPVQEVIGSKAYYHARYAIVATNSTFTSSAWKLAMANHVTLIDRKRLYKILNNKNKKIASDLLSGFVNQTCPVCGKQLKIESIGKENIIICSDPRNCTYKKEIYD